MEKKSHFTCVYWIKLILMHLRDQRFHTQQLKNGMYRKLINIANFDVKVDFFLWTNLIM